MFLNWNVGCKSKDYYAHLTVQKVVFSLFFYFIQCVGYGCEYSADIEYF